ANTSNDTKFHNITVNKKDEILIDNSDGTDGSSSSSSSGSSSGGGGTSGEAFVNIDIKETQRESVNKNTKVSFSYNSKGNIIRYINFTGLINSGTVATQVEILKNTSTLVDTAAPDNIYKNLNIWPGNQGWATSKNIDNPVIEFYVEKSWITANNIDETTITMNRYNSGNWDKLTTTLITRDAEKLYFISNTSGFASFAVTGKQVVADQAGGEGIEEQIIRETPEHISTQTQKDIPGFGLLICLIVLLIAINYRKK
ncbi:MAG: PGF-pre-PGF domain-containing protein, partial [Euryarchaeota archaeon]|nr:PGF-pre-PGF domain-containing protein [Euryarchaeota archaeon]